MEARQPGRRLIGTAVLLGILLSQPGHALGYLAVYGGRSLALQAQGVHAYFPVTFHLAVDLLVTAAVVAVGFIGLGRVLIGSAFGLEAERPVRARDLIAVLVIVQLNVFLFQEVVEASVIGLPVDGRWLASALLAAALGQVPVAVAAGFLLAWCAVGFRSTIRRLRTVLAAVRDSCTPRESIAPVVPFSFSPATLESACPPVFRKRGPPRTSSHSPL